MENILLSFSTRHVQPIDLMYCGRFECAILGLAWFTDSAGFWQLKAFSPGLGCYGAFQQLPLIRLIRFGANNYGCYLGYTNGGAGGPYNGDLFIFGLINGKLRELLTVENAEQNNSQVCIWKYHLNNSSSDTGFGDISLFLTGTCHANSSDYQADELLRFPLAHIAAFVN